MMSLSQQAFGSKTAWIVLRNEGRGHREVDVIPNRVSLALEKEGRASRIKFSYRSNLHYLTW